MPRGSLRDSALRAVYGGVRSESRQRVVGARTTNTRDFG
jgi:hypothetical protein